MNNSRAEWGFAVLLLGVASGAVLAQAPGVQAPPVVPVAAEALPSPSAAPPAAPAAGSAKDELTRLPSAADLRPSGPVTIAANRAELVQGNSAIYVGSVTMDSDTLKMDGDRLELKRFGDGEYTAKVNGSPAHMSHAGTGPDNPSVSGRAKVMNYDSRAGVIDLEGDAELMRGNDQTTADKIRYYLADRHYEASGGGGGNGRVTIVIPQLPGTPPPAAAPAAPAPAPVAAPALPKP